MIFTDTFTVSPTVTASFPSGNVTLRASTSITGGVVSAVSAAYSSSSSSSIRSATYRSSPSATNSVMTSSWISDSSSSSIVKSCSSDSSAYSSTFPFPITIQPASNNAIILFLFICISFSITPIQSRLSVISHDVYTYLQSSITTKLSL